jgi:hypothetical protein
VSGRDSAAMSIELVLYILAVALLVVGATGRWRQAVCGFLAAACVVLAAVVVPGLRAVL